MNSVVVNLRNRWRQAWGVASRRPVFFNEEQEKKYKIITLEDRNQEKEKRAAAKRDRPSLDNASGGSRKSIRWCRNASIGVIIC